MAHLRGGDALDVANWSQLGANVGQVGAGGLAAIAGIVGRRNGGALGPGDGLSVAAKGAGHPPKPRAYSTAFEMQLKPTSYPGVSRARHFQEANEQLLRAMEGDAAFASQMKELGVNLERTSTGLAPRTPPAGWAWHHDAAGGVMRLVPSSQHTPGSPFWDVLHPGGPGGFSIWGKE